MRISEYYVSVQGEGPNVGARTCFVRFAGCNLRCPGWPCDTPFAIDPKAYRHTWKQVTPDELLLDIVSVTHSDKATRICFTGGEPMLQKEDELIQLVTELRHSGYTLEMFSNGTIEYPVTITNNVQIIMDWKLLGSGEDPYNLVRVKNLRFLGANDAVKFVCKDRDDYELAKSLYIEYMTRPIGFQPTVYYGVVWNSKLQTKEIVKWVLEDLLPWKLNLQVHNMIWPAHERSR